MSFAGFDRQSCTKAKIHKGDIERNYLDKLIQEAQISTDSAATNRALWEKDLKKFAIGTMLKPTTPDIFMQKLSLQLNEDTDAKEIFKILAEASGQDIEVDPSITGSMILTLKDRPLNDFLEIACDRLNLKYYFNKSGILKIERDTPYMAHYQANIINDQRSTKATYALDTTQISGGSGGISTSIGTESSTKAWDEISVGIARIMGVAAETSVSQSFNQQSLQTSQKIVDSGHAAQQIAQPQVVTVQTVPAQTSQTTPQVEAHNLPQEQIVTTQRIVTAPPVDNSISIASHSEDDEFYSINRLAGLISVQTTQKKHRKILKYINTVMKLAQSQVLIEAKIIEVQLNKDYRAGIDWTAILSTLVDPVKLTTSNQLSVASSQPSPLSSDATMGNLAINITPIMKINSLSSVINLLDQFGNYKTVANPRIQSTNNQQAVISFTRNYVYFQLTVSNTSNPSTSTSSTTPPTSTNNYSNNVETNVSSTMNSVPVGIVLVMQPSISEDSNEITLNIRPTVSRIVQTIKDPATEYILRKANINTAGLSSDIPVIDVKTMDSVVNLKNGEIVVVGGLMQETKKSVKNVLPFLGRIPILDPLVNGFSDSKEVIETVILIKATIVDRESVRMV